MRELVSPLLVFPSAKLLLHLLTYRGYGIFRDELYYFACSERLAFGYVDHPPLSILLLWIERQLLGDSLFALRLPAAIAGAMTVLLVGMIARQLGGRTLAQSVAMVSALAAPAYLGTNHVYSMNSFDMLFWAAAAYLLILIVQGGDRRLWIALGVVLGLGLQNKISVLWLGCGLLVGLVLSQRRLLGTPGPWQATEPSSARSHARRVTGRPPRARVHGRACRSLPVRRSPPRAPADR